MWGLADDRRSQYFNLRLPVKCRRIDPPFTFGPSVICESLNISSKGLLFTTTETFQPGQVVEAFIDWPVLLDNCTRLRLVVEGPVVWKEGDEAAMRIDRYQFKTCGAAKWGSDPSKAISTKNPRATATQALPRT